MIARPKLLTSASAITLTGGAGSNPLTFDVTVPRTGPDVWLLIFGAGDNNGTQAPFTVTYGGITCTALIEVAGSASAQPAFIYFLRSPAAGTATLSIDWSVTGDIFAGAGLVFSSVSRLGVPQSATAGTTTAINVDAQGVNTGYSLGFANTNNDNDATYVFGQGETRLVLLDPASAGATTLAISGKRFGGGSRFSHSWTGNSQRTTFISLPLYGWNKEEEDYEFIAAAGGGTFKTGLLSVLGAGRGSFTA